MEIITIRIRADGMFDLNDVNDIAGKHILEVELPDNPRGGMARVFVEESIPVNSGCCNEELSIRPVNFHP